MDALARFRIRDGSWPGDSRPFPLRLRGRTAGPAHSRPPKAGAPAASVSAARQSTGGRPGAWRSPGNRRPFRSRRRASSEVVASRRRALANRIEELPTMPLAGRVKDGGRRAAGRSAPSLPRGEPRSRPSATGAVGARTACWEAFGGGLSPGRPVLFGKSAPRGRLSGWRPELGGGSASLPGAGAAWWPRLQDTTVPPGARCARSRPLPRAPPLPWAPRSRRSHAANSRRWAQRMSSEASFGKSVNSKK